MEYRRLHLILRQLRVTNAFAQESERIDLLFQRNNIDDNTMDKRKTRVCEATETFHKIK